MRFVNAWLLSVSLSTSLAAGPFSDLVVFGDSLSDVGNASKATSDLVPGPFYFAGRFSNGSVYAERLSSALGLGTLTPSSEGGNNFAFGGAQTSGTGGLPGLFIDDIDEQVGDFLAGPYADVDALIVMFAGADDLLGGQTNVSVPVSNLVNDLQRLIAAQFDTFLVLNLPPLGATPRFNRDPVLAAAMNQLTLEFNAALMTALDSLQISEPTVSLFRLDVAGLFDEVIADPNAFGLINITDPAAPGLEPGDSSYDTSQIARDPNSYLFWDELHPTAAAHAILAQQALAIVPEPSGILFLGVGFFAIATGSRRIARARRGITLPGG
jgi:phospholipase/lecithinase/hemolysin